MKIPFQPFDPFKPVHIYQHGYLPHWRQEGCTYFVTFRLADSLPAPLLEKWKLARSDWLKRHGIDPTARDWRSAYKRLSPHLQQQLEFHIHERLDDYLDRGHGQCLFRAEAHRQFVDRAIKHFDLDRMWLGDHVLMPNHAHALIRPRKGHELSDLLRSIKGFSSREINRAMGTRGPLWQKESYDRIVREASELRRIQQYIRNNPAKAFLNDDQFTMTEASYDLAPH